MKNLPVAVQLYSIREAAEKDFIGTLRQIKAMGYDGVELAGLYDLDPHAVRSILDELGLKAISAHVPFADLKADPAGVLEVYRILGCPYVAIPYLVEHDRPGGEHYSETLKSIEIIGQAAQIKGIQLLYHNHDFEFAILEDGSYGLDDLYRRIPASLLQTELDTCWVKISGLDPAAYLRQYTGRSPVVHLKDFFKEGQVNNLFELLGLTLEKQKETGGIFEFRPLGQGLQDIPALLKAALDAGSQWVVVEQDLSNGRTPLEAVRMSREYLKSLGW